MCNVCSVCSACSACRERVDDDGIYNKRVGRGRPQGPLTGMLDEQAHVFCTSVLLAHTSDKLHLGGRAGDGGSKPGLRLEGIILLSHVLRSRTALLRHLLRSDGKVAPVTNYTGNW